MQFLSVSGYIAGVTNPIFEQRQEWYDILCNVATGEVKLSESYQNELADPNVQPLYNKVSDEELNGNTLQIPIYCLFLRVQPI